MNQKTYPEVEQRGKREKTEKFMLRKLIQRNIGPVLLVILLVGCDVDIESVFITSSDVISTYYGSFGDAQLNYPVLHSDYTYMFIREVDDTTYIDTGLWRFKDFNRNYFVRLFDFIDRYHLECCTFNIFVDSTQGVRREYKPFQIKKWGPFIKILYCYNTDLNCQRELYYTRDLREEASQKPETAFSLEESIEKAVSYLQSDPWIMDNVGRNFELVMLKATYRPDNRSQRHLLFKVQGTVDTLEVEVTVSKKGQNWVIDFAR